MLLDTICEEPVVVNANSGRHRAARPAFEYGRYVGRVGALAAALGVGLAVANGGGIAWADDRSGSSSDGGSSPDAGPGDATSAQTTPAADRAADTDNGVETTSAPTVRRPALALPRKNPSPSSSRRSWARSASHPA